jgi:DNA-binding beta-propeller fold protein YncE
MKTHWIFALLATSSALALPVQAQRLCSPTTSHVQTVVGPGVYELAYSPRQDAVYAAMAGGFNDDAPPSSLVQLDAATLQEQSRLLLPYRAFGLALDDQANRLYVGHSLQGRISVIDTQRNRRLHTVQLSQLRPDGKRYEHDLRGLILDKSQGLLFVPGLSAGQSVLFVLDSRNLALKTRIPDLGFYPTGLALDEQGGRLYVSTMAGEIVVIDTRALRIQERWTLPGVHQPINLAYYQGRLYVTDQGLDSITPWQQRLLPKRDWSGSRQQVLMLDATDGQILAAQPVQGNPLAIRLDTAAGLAYVSERSERRVAVYSLDTLRPVAAATTDKLANSLALDTRTGRVYVSLKNPAKGQELQEESVGLLCFDPTPQSGQ